MNIQKLRDMNLGAVADELEQLRAFKAEVESQKPTAQTLDSPAQVNHTVYGVGIEHSVVINAAQRYYQHMQEPSPDAEALANAKEDMRKLIADKPASRRAAGQLQALADQAGVYGIRISVRNRSENTASEILRSSLDAIREFESGNFREFEDPIAATLEVPDGWKLVPIEPTEAMAVAAMNVEDESIRTMGHSVPFLDLWHAMLTASPALDHSDDKPAVAVPGCLKHFVDHDFHQLPVYDDGRTPLCLTEEQYNAIKSLAAAPSNSQQSAGEDTLSIIGKALESTVGGLSLASDGTSEVEIYDPMAGDGTRLICFDNHSQLIAWAERTVALFNPSPALDSEQGGNQ